MNKAKIDNAIVIELMYFQDRVEVLITAFPPNPHLVYSRDSKKFVPSNQFNGVLAQSYRRGESIHLRFKNIETGLTDKWEKITAHHWPTNPLICPARHIETFNIDEKLFQ